MADPAIEEEKQTKQMKKAKGIQKKLEKKVKSQNKLRRKREAAHLKEKLENAEDRVDFEDSTRVIDRDYDSFERESHETPT